MQHKSVIFVIVLVLVVALVHSSYSGFEAFAEPKDENWDYADSCREFDPGRTTCCWREVDGDYWCQTCDWNGVNCTEVFLQPQRPGLGVLPEGGVLEEPPTPPSGPAAPLQDGGVLQQPPSQGVAPPPTRGQGALPQDGVLQQEPTDEGTVRTIEPPAEDEATPLSAEPVPPCPEGQVIDEKTELCVLEESQAVEQPEEQTQAEEEQQPTEEEDGSGDNSNN